MYIYFNINEICFVPVNVSKYTRAFVNLFLHSLAFIFDTGRSLASYYLGGGIINMAVSYLNPQNNELAT